MNLALILAILALLALFVWFGGRALSRKRAFPCPAFLSWLVDNPLARRRATTVLELLKLAPGMSVLDAGCGPGRLAVPIAAAIGPEGRLLAVDMQPRMLERAQAKAASAGLTNIDLLQAGLGEGRSRPGASTAPCFPGCWARSSTGPRRCGRSSPRSSPADSCWSAR